MNGYTTGTATTADREALISLTQASGEGFATHGAFGHWFSGHPHGPVRVAVVRNKGRIVGACWIFPLRVEHDGRPYQLSHVGNLLVHPEHRGGFAYALLSRRVNAEAAHLAPAHVSFVTERTRERYGATTPGAVTTWPWLVRVLDPEAWAEAYAKRRGQPAVRGVARSIARLLSPALPAIPRDVRILEGEAAFDRLGEPLGSAPKRVTPATDAAYFRWRFGPGTERTYTPLAVEGAGNERAVAVLRIDHWERGHTAVLCHSDATSPEAHAALLTACVLRSADEGAAILEALVPSRRTWAQGFRAVGLLPNPGRRWRRLEGLWPAPQSVLVNTHDASNVPAPITAARSWEPTLQLHETV